MVSPVLSRVSERARLLLPIADDELVLGWRNSEWTGIAPFLEEDVAFSSIAQNEIGHARALYQLVADEPRFQQAVEELRPLQGEPSTGDFAELWEEMTMVRRSVVGATW